VTSRTPKLVNAGVNADGYPEKKKISLEKKIRIPATFVS